jgi:hypothetical protein
MKFHTKLAASVLLGTMIGLSSVAQAKDSTNEPDRYGLRHRRHFRKHWR